MVSTFVQRLFHEHLFKLFEQIAQLWQNLWWRLKTMQIFGGQNLVYFGMNSFWPNHLILLDLFDFNEIWWKYCKHITAPKCVRFLQNSKYFFLWHSSMWQAWENILVGQLNQSECWKSLTHFVTLLSRPE